MLKNKLVLKKSSTLREAVKLLDQSGTGVLAVVDKKNKLIGLITDGDIRKSVLSNELSLKKIINKKPYKIHFKSSKIKILNYLKKIRRQHVPLVDDNDKFIKIFSINYKPYQIKPNWVVIMAGGLGSRLGDLTKKTPKPMLKINDIPILEHIITNFISSGFSNFLISVNYKSEIIKNYFKDGTDLGVKIKYLEEKKFLGTGGSLSLIDFKISDPFFVINGDIFTNINFQDILDSHVKNKSKATMCIKEYEFKIPYSVIKKDKKNKFLSISEKPTNFFFINSGIYLFEPEIISHIPRKTFFDLPEIFEIIKKFKKKINLFEINNFWIDLGQLKDFENVTQKFTKIYELDNISN